MKKLFILSVLCFGCTVLFSAEEYTLKVNNNNAESVSDFPVVFKLAALGGNISAENCKVQIFDAGGKEIPSQLDDMNLDGKADETDEAAMLAVLKPGENVFKVKLLSGRFPAPQNAGKRELYLAAENGAVRIEQNKLKLQQRLISRFNNGKYERIAGHFVQELNIDNSWKWMVRPEIRAIRVSSGAVRQIIRFVSVVENRESGKQAEIINDMHIFSGRSEVFLRFQLTNISKGQLLQPCRINQGFYDTGINGKVIPDDDKFAGVGSKGETVFGSVASGSYNYRNRGGNAPVWMNYFRPGVGGVGFIANDLTYFDSGCIVYQAPRKVMRFSWLHCPKNLVLWPGKSLDLHSWLVLNAGNAKAVTGFANTLKNILL